MPTMMNRHEAARYLKAHPKRLPDQGFGTDSCGRVYLFDSKLGHERTIEPGRHGFTTAECDQLVEDCLPVT